MKIGGQHRNQMWRSLIEFRNSTSCHQMSSQSQEIQRGVSNASTCSSGVTSAAANGYSPGYYEITRYTFKHTISVNSAERQRREQQLLLSESGGACGAEGEHLLQGHL